MTPVMMARCLVSTVAVVLTLALMACGNDRQERSTTTTIHKETSTSGRLLTMKTDETESELPAGGHPELAISGAEGAIADAFRTELEQSSIVRRGSIGVTIELEPRKPTRSGTLNAEVSVSSLFAHLPELTQFIGTMTVRLDYTNVELQRLGQEMGVVTREWIDAQPWPEAVLAGRSSEER